VIQKCSQNPSTITPKIDAKKDTKKESIKQSVIEKETKKGGSGKPARTHFWSKFDQKLINKYIQNRC
jgi:hypothetical protein